MGVEEQFYLLYPMIFFFLKDEKKKFILPSLVLLTFLSLVAFFTSVDVASKFYFLQYRFFELSIGGICAIYFRRRNFFINISKSHYLLHIFLIALVFLLFFKSVNSNDIKILITTILTAGILVLGDLHFENNYFYKALTSNKLFVGIGKISFSLYMWHQIVFAFSRYFLIEEITLNYAIILSIIVVVLSTITYFIIEKPFRDKNKIKTNQLLIILGFTFLIVMSTSLYVYMIGGYIRDVPELGINKSNKPSQLNFFSSSRNINIQYNEDVRALDKPFSEKSDKIKVLVLGNSFGRDLANVLLESSFKDTIEVRYFDLNFNKSELKVRELIRELKNRIKNADFIFFGSNYPTEKSIVEYNIDMNKVWIVGPKNFGNSSGIHYNRKVKNYSIYRTSMKTGVLEENLNLKKKWGKKYIDLISLVADSDGKVLVFTPDGKFISQDTEHFTKFGAIFFSRLLDAKFREIMKLSL